MSKGTELSPKYGVNPTQSVCAWCGEVKGIALMGRIRSHKGAHDDIEAPPRMVLDYEPCEECQKKWSTSVTCIEVTDVPPEDGRPPIQIVDGTKLYPTFRYVGIKPEIVSKVFGPSYVGHDKILLEDKAFENFFGDILREKECE